VIDTPGMRELQLWADEDEVGGAFPEIEELARGCRFRDCRHELEPGCAVREALESGTLDAGRYVTLPLVFTRHPVTGKRNVGMYRIQIYDDRTTGMHWQLQKVGARHGRRYYETGTRMPVAIFLGGDPVFTFAATAPLPDGLTNSCWPVISAKNPLSW